MLLVEPFFTDSLGVPDKDGRPAPYVLQDVTGNLYVVVYQIVFRIAFVWPEHSLQILYVYVAPTGFDSPVAFDLVQPNECIRRDRRGIIRLLAGLSAFPSHRMLNQGGPKRGC